MAKASKKATPKLRLVAPLAVVSEILEVGEANKFVLRALQEAMKKGNKTAIKIFMDGIRDYQHSKNIQAIKDRINGVL